MREMKDVFPETGNPTKAGGCNDDHEVMKNKASDGSRDYAVCDHGISPAIILNMTIDDYFNTLK